MIDPQVGEVWGPIDKPREWRFVGGITARDGWNFVDLRRFGHSFASRVPKELWFEWVAASGAVRIGDQRLEAENTQLKAELSRLKAMQSRSIEEVAEENRELRIELNVWKATAEELKGRP